MSRDGRLSAIAAAVARRSEGRIAITCKSCRRAINPATVDTIREQLMNLGARPDTLALHSPLCGRCARQIVELAVDLHENREAS